MKKKKEKRFITVHTEGSFNTSTEIFVDKETGVNYVFRSSGFGGGLSPLLDSEGKPIVTPITEEK